MFETVVRQLASEALRKFGMEGWHPTFVTDAGANVSAGLDKAGIADWCRCYCHLIHNVVTCGMESLQQQSHHPTKDNRVWIALKK